MDCAKALNYLQESHNVTLSFNSLREQPKCIYYIVFIANLLYFVIIGIYVGGNIEHFLKIQRGDS